MKLSEAMLKGCQVSGYTDGSYIKYVNGNLCSCALGAAIIGVSRSVSSAKSEGRQYINDTFGIELQNLPTIPNLPLSDLSNLYNQITTVNDTEMKTREEIAMALAEVGL